MPTYQVHYRMPNGRLFALPVYGTKANIWDRLANHMHYRTFANWRTVIGFETKAKKAQFQLLEVAQ